MATARHDLIMSHPLGTVRPRAKTSTRKTRHQRQTAQNQGT